MNSPKCSDVSLAVSLHAPNDALRDELVPINRKYPIAELMAACRHYLNVLGEHRSITIEYTLMRGVNDSVAQAHELAQLLRTCAARSTSFRSIRFRRRVTSDPTTRACAHFRRCC